MIDYPVSPLIDAPLGDDILRGIAEAALDAFFVSVNASLEEYYPGSHTYGDVDPGEAMEREQIALRWINSHALNNTAVAAAQTDVEEN